MKSILGTTRRAAAITCAAVVCGILFCALTQGADAASDKTTAGDTSGTVTNSATKRAALLHEPVHVGHGGSYPTGGVKGESADDRHRGEIE
jgi:hypothetical protein